MTLTTPLATRWQRAQQIDPANIRPLGPGRFLVPSQQQADGYTVQITLNSAGRLTAATCACSDFRQGRATAADLHGVWVCKHTSWPRPIRPANSSPSQARRLP